MVHMRITRWGEYGILCALYLARKWSSGAVGAAEIAKTQAIPVQYTQQILQRLRKGGIIRSTRGPRGGYRLARPPGEINLYDVLHSVEGSTFELMCEEDPVYPKLCAEAVCGLHLVWQDLKNAVDGVLKSQTLAKVLARQREAGAVGETLVAISRGSAR
jgi:Rrf2 family iron-sulfur cluster assembly transcriptional regulator